MESVKYPITLSSLSSKCVFDVPRCPKSKALWYKKSSKSLFLLHLNVRTKVSGLST